jgi:hypothetical protein
MSIARWMRRDDALAGALPFGRSLLRERLRRAGGWGYRGIA